ncbi:hypothetical protein [Salinimicrobium sp. WS361]|uniref:hypothetical protein n=1 Tax=Salinimicrobium sp. WS361 TaxID=3425123 RepID=UPI003D6F5B7F
MNFRLLSLVIVLALVTFPGVGQELYKKGQPNIIFVLVDDMAMVMWEETRTSAGMENTGRFQKYHFN